MTKEGENFLREELKNLKFVDRVRVVKAIAEQNLMESRIREIESKLYDSQVIDVTQIHPTGKVIFGTTIEIKDVNDDRSVTYKMVGEDEADVKFGKISVNSPLSRNLVGKSEGDTFIFETPSGVKEYCIVSIKHL